VSLTEHLANSTRKLVVAQYVHPLVLGVLRNHARYEWTLQGFGMLRTYSPRSSGSRVELELRGPEGDDDP